VTAPSTERLPDVGVLFPFRAWLRHPAFRSSTTRLFVALVAVPPVALAAFQDDGGYTNEAWVFAAYFAVAWFVVLRALVAPRDISGVLLGQVCLIALVVEAPLAIWLETVLDADPENLAASILAIGVPEELAKMVPVVALTLIYRSRRPFSPRDTLFLGAVSGLVFGAGEAVHYVTEVMPALGATGVDGAIWSVWRFLTDPIAHALWAGVSGYFVGLAVQYRSPSRWFALAGLGLGVPAVLHGVNDWIGLNLAWALLAVVSAALFLGYARIGLVAEAASPMRVPTPSSARHAAPSEPLTAPIPVVRAPTSVAIGLRRPGT
jgi:RsiW-degrading membrane proteinase PrsW (M82 family)